jgi:hypothetical protein
MPTRTPPRAAAPPHALHHRVRVVALAAALALAGCGGGHDSPSASGGGTQAPPRPSRTAPLVGAGPPRASPLASPAVRRYRRRMAAACRRSRRAVAARPPVTSLGRRAVQARRERAAYAALRDRLARLKAPSPVRRPAGRYVRYVAGAVALSRQIAAKAERQQRSQVTRLIRELGVNTRLRRQIAKRLRVGPC